MQNIFVAVAFTSVGFYMSYSSRNLDHVPIILVKIIWGRTLTELILTDLFHSVIAFWFPYVTILPSVTQLTTWYSKFNLLHSTANHIVPLKK